MKFLRRESSLIAWVGPWQARFAWDRAGVFGNGSRWFSGWHRWEIEDD